MAGYLDECIERSEEMEREKKALSGTVKQPCCVLPEMKFEEAEELWKATEYANEAVEEDEPINGGDATAFFLEGYEYARKQLKKHNALNETP